MAKAVNQEWFEKLCADVLPKFSEKKERFYNTFKSNFYNVTSFSNVAMMDKMHYGIDISGTGFRSPIYSVDEGVVVEVNYRSVDGNFVIIQHDNNIYTQYAHMYKSTVTVGQQVKTGDKIGEMGETGLAFGVHLHFGVSIGWPYHGSYQFQNPLKYIKLR